MFDIVPAVALAVKSRRAGEGTCSLFPPEAFAILLDSNHVYTRGQIDVDATGCYMGDCTHCNEATNECLCPRVCKCFECADYQKKCGDYVGDVVRCACANFQPEPNNV